MKELADINYKAIWGTGEEKQAAIAIRNMIVNEIAQKVQAEYSSTMNNLTSGDGTKWSWYCGRVSGELVLIVSTSGLGELKNVKYIKLASITEKVDDLLRLFKESRFVEALINTVDNNAGSIGKVIGIVDNLQRDKLLEIVKNPRLRSFIEETYRQGAKIGDGGLADAIRYEVRTGELVGGKSHIQKGIERVKNLENVINKADLDETDMKIAKALLKDLQDSLNGN